MAFGNDAFLWYGVGNWAPLGLAIPNFGNDRTSQNGTIRNLTQTMGRNLQAVMFHPDARLRTPPSINTLTRIHKLCTRVRSILASRAVPAGKPNLESDHAIPAGEEFLVFPCPYFKVRNTWLKEYCGLALIAMTEAFQHSENAKPLEISETFSGMIGQYIHRIYRLMSVELLKVPATEAEKPDFTLTEEQLRAYDPTKWFSQTEMIDTVARDEEIPTEDDLEVLTNGIPISQLPVLGRWPSGPITAGTPASSGTAPAPAESFAPPPGA